nr:hypothetical protein [uncultured Carboxylicivirga sp.]
MRNFNIYKILTVLVLSSALFSCYESDVEPVIDPAGYSTATIELEGSFDGTVEEGDILTYNITLDKAMETDLEFDIKELAGDAVRDEDFIVTGGVIPGYATSTTLTVEFVANGIPEESKTLDFQVGVFALGQRYTLNPSTVMPEYSTTLKSVNDETGLTVAVEWDNHDDDWDLMIIDEAVTGEWTGWAGATGDNPEVTLLTNDVPDGVYYVEVDPYSVENDVVHFNISIGKPDQSVEFFEWTYNAAESGDYPVGVGYQLVKIVKSGTGYTCSLVE